MIRGDENRAAPSDEQLGPEANDFGAVLHATTVVVGERLGLYKAMADGEPVSAEQLAERTGTDPRYIAEWLAAQAASGWCEYHAQSETFRLTEEQVFVLTSTDNPLYLPGAYLLAASTIRDEPAVTEAFRTGAGIGWHQHHHDLFHGTEKFFRPGYVANLTTSWIPALDGVEAKLQRGASVADIGCGHGASTIIMALAYPNSTFVGFDYHDASIETARKAAAEAGVSDRVRFEIATATDFPGTGYDLVCVFDALHDMGDPTGAAAHVLSTLDADGTWLVVEPMANDALEDNLNPVGRVFYSASTSICTPASRDQAGAACLGAQAGEARLREVVTAGGFTRFRRATETPFNLVLEARP